MCQFDFVGFFRSVFFPPSTCKSVVLFFLRLLRGGIFFGLAVTPAGS
jgi:hypothetical protein